MTKINHSRPYLKYIDNIRRENAKAAARYKHLESFSNAGSIHKKPKRDTFWDKMAAIELSEFEEEKIFELFDLVAKYFDTQLESIELIFKKGKGKRRKTLQLKADKIYGELVHIGEQLIASEAAAQMRGREKGVFNWWNLLRPKLRRDGADDFLDLVNNHVFKEALSNVESQLKI
jgi:hypothetical protein